MLIIRLTENELYHNICLEREAYESAINVPRIFEKIFL